MNKQVKVNNEKKLGRYAKELWETISPALDSRAVILALEGPLGAGKTTLTKALAAKAGIKETVASPTFILCNQYSVTSNQLTLDHIDAWRMDSFEELERLGLAEMVRDNHLIVIEWADKFRDQLSALSAQCLVIWIKIEYGEQENERIINYENIGC